MFENELYKDAQERTLEAAERVMDFHDKAFAATMKQWEAGFEAQQSLARAALDAWTPKSVEPSEA